MGPLRHEELPTFNSPLVDSDILPKIGNSLETVKININLLLKRDKFYSFVVLFP
jgi:hypothetical protein